MFVPECLYAAVGGLDVVADGVGALAGTVVQRDVLQTARGDLGDQVVGGPHAQGA